MAFTKHRPSLILLSSTILLTSGVIFMNARMVLVLNVRYSVLEFMFESHIRETYIRKAHCTHQNL